MAYAITRLNKCVGCRSPLPGSGLPCEDKPGSAGAGEASELGRHELPATSLRVENLLDGLVEVLGLHRGGTVVFPPCVEQLGKVLAAGVIRLEGFDTLHRVSAP
jgi:hypothetical protein